MAPSPPDSPSPPGSPRESSRPKLLASISEALTADLDESKFHFLHPRRIPWMQNPLHVEPSAEGEGGGDGDGEELAPEQSREVEHEAKSAEAVVKKDGHAHHLHFGPDPFELAPDEPPLRYQTESSTIQLFYDLFFVANLTTFTAKHDVSDGSTLKSYVGYFGLLWFTWLQVALFDIRFGHDSAFERICKAAQFGVMVGLAVEGTSYDLEEFKPTAFRNISLILVASRLVLMVQYTVALLWLKDFKKARMPLIFHIGTMFVAAMVFLGLSFFFKRPNGVRIIDGWYVTLGIEAAVILFVSGRTSFLNFRRTNIIERLGLLTLIILGEGIMGLGEQVSKINDADGVFSSDVIGLIVSSTAIIYFIYMLYFDQTETKGRRVGSVRQQLWTIGHFPLHVCILLVVAGLGQMTVWRKINDSMNDVWNMMNANLPEAPYNTPADWQNYVNSINTTLNQQWPGGDYNPPLDAILANHTDWYAVFMAQWDIMGTVSSYVAGDFNVEIPDQGADGMDEVFNLFQTVFIYFFVGAGLVLVCLACIFMLGKKSKTRIEYISAGVRLFVGTGLAFLSTMIIPWNNENASQTSIDEFANYFSSPWMVPTVVLAYALVVALDVMLIFLSRKLLVRRGSVASDKV